MEPLGVMAHGAPCSCVLSSPSPPSPSPLDPDCFWIVQMTADCPLRGIVFAWGRFTPVYPWLILRLKCIWPDAEEWHLIDESKSCSNDRVECGWWRDSRWSPLGWWPMGLHVVASSRLLLLLLLLLLLRWTQIAFGLSKWLWIVQTTGHTWSNWLKFFSCDFSCAFAKAFSKIGIAVGALEVRERMGSIAVE